MYPILLNITGIWILDLLPNRVLTEIPWNVLCNIHIAVQQSTASYMAKISRKRARFHQSNEFNIRPAYHCLTRGTFSEWQLGSNKISSCWDCWHYFLIEIITVSRRLFSNLISDWLGLFCRLLRSDARILLLGDDDCIWKQCYQRRLLLILVGMRVFTQWASYQIRKIAGCACAGDAGNVFPATVG